MAGPSPRDNYDPNASVSPQTGMPEDYLRVNANPNVYGAQVGEAAQKFGATTTDVGSQVISTAEAFQQQKNTTDANQATMKYADYATNLEMELRKKRGQNALDAYPQFDKGLSDGLEQMANQLKSPMARTAFLTDARTFYDRSKYNSGAYIADESNKLAVESSAGKIQAYNNLATLNFGDPRALQDGINKTVEETLQNAHNTLGITDPNAVHAMVSKNVGELISSVISAQVAQGTTAQAQKQSLDAANKLFQNLKGQSVPGSPGVPMLDAEQQDKITQMLQWREYSVQGKLDRQQDQYEASLRAGVNNSQVNITAMVEKGITVPDNQFSSDAAIMRAYPKNPEIAQEKIDDNNLLKAMSHYSGLLPGATPQQVQQMREAAQPDANHPETFAKQARISSALDSTLNIRARMLSKDPVGYTVQNDPQILNLFNEGIQHPEAFGTYAHEVQTQQDTMGVPLNQQRILPEQAATQIANEIQGNPQASQGVIQKYQKQFGDFWPQAYHDITTLGKLPSEYQAVANLDTGDGEILSKVLAQNSTGKAISELLPSKGGAAIKTNIQDRPEVLKLETSLAASGASPQQTQSIVDSVTSLAYGNAYFKGQNIKDAADNAIKAFTGNYEYIGTARVPSNKFDNVTQNSQQLLQRLDENKINLPLAIGAIPGGVTKDEYLDTLRAAPTWITSPKGDALWLMDMGGRIVRDRQGNPMSVRFDAPPPVADQAQLDAFQQQQNVISGR